MRGGEEEPEAKRRAEREREKERNREKGREGEREVGLQETRRSVEWKKIDN